MSIVGGLLGDWFNDIRASNRAEDYAQRAKTAYENDTQGAILPPLIAPEDQAQYGATTPQMQARATPLGEVGAPSQDYYHQRSFIPTQENFGLQAQRGDQAMTLQASNQMWQESSMTMAQKVAAEANAQNIAFEQDRKKYEFENLSGYQQEQVKQADRNFGLNVSQAEQQATEGNARTQQGWANVGINQQQLNNQTRQIDATVNRDALIRQFPALGLTGKDAIEFDANRNRVNAAVASTTDAIDYLTKVGIGEKTLDPGTVGAMQADLKLNMLPVMAKLIGTGALQKNDMDFIEGIMGTPGALMSLDSRQVKRLGMINETIKREQGTMYNQMGQNPPVTEVGQSSWSKSNRSGSAPSKNVEWSTPGTNPNSRKAKVGY